MLHEGYKMELRILIFVASLEPMIVYVNPRPIFRLCHDLYDPKQNNREAHVCNPKTLKQYLDDMDLLGLEEYMIKQGFVTEKGWANSTFIPNLKKLIITLF